MEPLEKKEMEINEQTAEATEQVEPTKTDGTQTEKPQLPPHEEYAKRMGNFIAYYRQLLVFIGVVALMGVVIAVAENVILGSCTAILSAALYVYFTSDELFKKLGLRYSSTEEGVEITRCRVRYGDTFYIPEALIELDVVRIREDAFTSQKNASLRCLYLPATLRELPQDLPAACPHLEQICFGGDESAWNCLTKPELPTHVSVSFSVEYPKPISRKKTKAK